LANLIRVKTEIAEALVILKKYIKYTTGRKATETEIANTLKSYFILNEIGNQINYLRSKAESPAASSPITPKGPIWTINLISASSRDNLTKAGLFSQCIQEGIQAAVEFVEKTTGKKPTHDEIAHSLKSTFILSEIKNQINWQRKNHKKAPKAPQTV
jgi:hypothetical protein